jgi:hypothetical protein
MAWFWQIESRSIGFPLIYPLNEIGTLPRLSSSLDVCGDVEPAPLRWIIRLRHLVSRSLILPCKFPPGTPSNLIPCPS